MLGVGIIVAGKVSADQTYDQTNASHVWDATTSNWNNSTATWINDVTNNAIFTGASLAVDVNGSINVGNITFNSNGWNIGDPTTDGSLTFAAPSTVTVTNTADTATISANIISGSLTKAGTGTLVLSGNNTFDGNVTVGAGILKISSNTALGSTVGTTSVASGAALILGNGVTVTGETITPVGNGINSTGALEAEAGASATWAGTILLDSAGTRIGAKDGGVLTVSGVIQNGTGNTLTISGAPLAVVPGVVIISGTSNTYTGPTQIIRGILKIGATNALPTGTVLDVDQSSAAEDSTFDLNGFNQTVGALQRTGNGSGTGASFVTNNGASPSTLTLNQTATTTYTGIIKDGISTVALTKSGSGSLTLAGANTYSGATTVTGGTLTLTGSLNNTAISVTASTFSENASGAVTGNSSFVFNSGTSGLNGANTFTGTVTVGGSAVLNVNGNNALGSTAAGTMVNNGGRLVLTTNGLQITGETLTINGSGGNNFGALQTSPGVSAEWAGNIIVALDASRLGGVNGGTLTITGAISTSGTVNSILFSRGGGTTVLNGVSTYTADTQMFADTTQGAATIKINVDNAINAGSKLSVIATAASNTMTLDLNGHVLTLKGLDTSGNQASGAFLNIVNNGASPNSALSLADNTGGDTFSFSGTLKDGTSGTGGLSLVKGGNYTQILVAANTYTGSTTVNGGTLQIGGAVSTLGVNGSLASTAFTLNGGTFALNNAGASNNNTNRLSDSAVFTMKGGTFLFTGSDQASTNSSETVGTLALTSGISKITATANGNLASLTAGQLTHSVNGGIALVNGVGLGKDASSNVGRIFTTTAPTLIGTTAAQSTGINAAAQNTQIVPYLLGEATSTTGGVSTLTGTPNTFVTYEATTGYRPLNLTDEFTQNAFTAGNNIRLTTGTPNVASSVAINSLILEGASATVASGQTLTVSSGAILFSTGNTLSLTGGNLTFTSGEGIVTINATGNTTIGSIITGNVAMSYYGSGTLVLGGQQSTYTGNTLLQVGTVIPQASSVFSGSTLVSGAFGTGTLILGGSALRSTTSSAIAIGNAVSFAADTTVITSGGADQPLTFSGAVTLAGNRTLTQNSNANTVFTNAIGDGGNGFVLTVTGSGSGAVLLGGSNTYTGATLVKGSTVVVSGSLSASSAVTIGDAANLSKTAVLGGSGTIGSVTVGAAPGNSGAMLNPHAGSSASNAGVTLHATSVTFASSARLSLQIGRNSAFTGSPGDGTAGGDVSDHLATTGALTLNGADLKLSLLTTSYTPVNGDIFFLTINSGGAINGTFASLNQVATNLSEGSVFSLNSQSYQITYLANFSTNSFTGGNDVALLAVVPEPGALVSLIGGLGCLLGVQRVRRPRLKNVRG
jgi:autotransporter-associated beta strand protein